MDIILDIKILIATALSELPYSDDIVVWIRLMMIDDEFRIWTRTDTGINRFIHVFTKTITHGISIKNFMVNVFRQYGSMSTLFGMLHSINDQPSYVSGNLKVWHKYIIFEDGSRDSVKHRDGDNPRLLVLLFKDGIKMEIVIAMVINPLVLTQCGLMEN